MQFSCSWQYVTNKKVANLMTLTSEPKNLYAVSWMSGPHSAISLTPSSQSEKVLVVNVEVEVVGYGPPPGIISICILNSGVFPLQKHRQQHSGLTGTQFIKEMSGLQQPSSNTHTHTLVSGCRSKFDISHWQQRFQGRSGDVPGREQTRAAVNLH